MNNITQNNMIFGAMKGEINILIYRISANSFRGNYSFLKLSLCTVTFGQVTVHKSAETIQGRKLFKCGNYSRKYGTPISNCDFSKKMVKNFNIFISVKDVRISRLQF